MGNIKFDLNRIKNKKRENWKDNAVELTEYYGRSCFWLYHKFHPYKIKQAHKKNIENGSREFSHLMQQLYHS